MKEITRNDIKNWTGILFLVGVFLILINFFETSLVLNEYIIPPANVKLPNWLTNYQIITYCGFGLALAAVIFWYYWSSCKASFCNEKEDNKAKFIWGLLFGVLCLVLLVCIFLTSAQEGIWIAYLFFAINILGFYYLTTVLFSPISAKHIPPKINMHKILKKISE